MSPWFAKAVILLATIVMVAIRAPYGQRSLRVPVVKSFRGKIEVTLLTIAWVAFVLPLIWIATPLLAFADYPLRPLPFLVGTSCLAIGLWLFHRSHADLGTNWSITLALRENHQLVVDGLYGSVRHPMYLALLIYSAGQALVLPNYVAGPSYCVAMLLLFAFRMRSEERMMLEQFGKDYEAYTAQTKRLIPGLW
jgi:protein-S-isoprenylcysteine O-methyltransferase Ste14